MKKFTDYLQELGWAIGEMEEESDLSGITTINVGCYSLSFSHDLERVELKEYKNMEYKLPLPVWKKEIEEIFLKALKVRSEEIYANEAERYREEYEAKCRRHEIINYAGTMSGE